MWHIVQRIQFNFQRHDRSNSIRMDIFLNQHDDMVRHQWCFSIGTHCEGILLSFDIGLDLRHFLGQFMAVVGTCRRTRGIGIIPNDSIQSFYFLNFFM